MARSQTHQAWEQQLDAPARRLCAAVLVRAIRDMYVTCVNPKVDGYCVRHEEAEFIRLLREGAHEFIYSERHVPGRMTVQWCCEVLGLDVAQVRGFVERHSEREALKQIKRCLLAYGGFQTMGHRRFDETDLDVDEWEEPVTYDVVRVRAEIDAELAAGLGWTEWGGRR